MNVHTSRFRREYLRRRRVRDRVIAGLLLVVIFAAYGVAEKRHTRLGQLEPFTGGNRLCIIGESKG